MELNAGGAGARAAEAEMETEAAERLKREVEALGYFLAVDFRAPLAHMAHMSRALLEKHSGGLDAEGRRLLAALHNNAGRLNDFLVRLLELSLSGHAHIETRPVDMTALALETWGDVKSLFPGHEPQLVLSGLPLAQADPILIRQAVSHLLSNAFKFTTNARKPQVIISGRPQGPESVYTVQDNGVGFDPAKTSRLFSPFQRLHAGADFQGLGLGLSLARRIIERNGGRIWAEGVPGKGACFHFALRGVKAPAPAQ
jgi:light-regulated signal transduction histidine kinase (bacteriophytochrome)